MGSRNVIVYFIMGVLAVVLGYDMYLQRQTQILTSQYYRNIIEQEEKDRQFIVEHVEDIYKLSALDSIRGYVTMDTLIRVFHYAKPHKSPAWACPECADIRKKGLPNKQLPGKRPKLPPQTGPARTANVTIPSDRRHDKSLKTVEGG
jgi:hypothetical protein|tara:strand:+ start:7442 stop:7882 length:441 start_codon:yes stop_codon:yes gene_type:complete